jgi:hypothetical protein
VNARRTAATAISLIAAIGILTACAGSAPKSSAQKQGQEQTETAFKQQSAAVPYPASQLTDSLERRNIRERLLRQNKPNTIGYVYVLGMNGTYVGYYAIKGKVSSTQSQMTTTDLIQSCGQGSSYSCAVTVPAPGDDGSYGQNEPGIFFFTTENVMVTTSMDYIASDQPLPVNAPNLNPTKP